MKGTATRVRPTSRSGGVVRAELRFRARRRALRLRALRPAVVVAAVVTVVVGFGWTALGSGMFAVQRVTVDGTSRLSPDDVLRAADVPLGRSLFLLDTTAVRRRVARLPQVAHVTVTASWPHRVVIRVEERRPVAVVNTPDGDVLVDATGVAFSVVPSAPPGLLQVHLAATVPGPGDADARAAMAVLATLPPQLRTRVRSVSVASPDAVSFRLPGDRTVVWGSVDDSRAKLAVLQVLMRRHPKVVRYDVSTPGVAVTR